MDLLAPLLHEFTLQAMANDLLKIEDGSKYSYSYASGQSSASRDVTLDENDWIWTSIRHKNIAELSQVIVNKFNEFLTDNKAAAGNKTGGAKDLKELKEMMGSMAEFQETKSLFSLHLTLAQEIPNQSDKHKLIALAKMEQDLATGLSKATSSGAASASVSSRGSITAFIIGGPTYSETRAVYELSLKNGRDFYIGGDRVLTPDLFLHGLCEQK